MGSLAGPTALIQRLSADTVVVEHPGNNPVNNIKHSFLMEREREPAALEDPRIFEGETVQGHAGSEEYPESIKNN